MDLELRDRRALVFGSSSGLGRAIAATLVREGTRVAVVSRSLDRARAALDEIGADVALRADLTVDGDGATAVAAAAWTPLRKTELNARSGLASTTERDVR